MGRFPVFITLCVQGYWGGSVLVFSGLTPEYPRRRVPIHPVKLCVADEQFDVDFSSVDRLS